MMAPVPAPYARPAPTGVSQELREKVEIAKAAAVSVGRSFFIKIGFSRV